MKAAAEDGERPCHTTLALNANSEVRDIVLVLALENSAYLAVKVMEQIIVEGSGSLLSAKSYGSSTSTIPPTSKSRFKFYVQFVSRPSRSKRLFSLSTAYLIRVQGMARGPGSCRKYRD